MATDVAVNKLTSTNGRQTMLQQVVNSHYYTSIEQIVFVVLVIRSLSNNLKEAQEDKKVAAGLKIVDNSVQKKGSPWRSALSTFGVTLLLLAALAVELAWMGIWAAVWPLTGVVVIFKLIHASLSS